MDEPPDVRGSSDQGRPATANVISAITALAAAVAAVAGAYAAIHGESSANDGTPSATGTAPEVGGSPAGICTLRGIADADYVNAALTGYSGRGSRDRVVAVVALLPDDRWYFQSVSQTGRRWSIDASTKFEVSTPEDGPRAPFSFRAVAAPTGARIPAPDRGYRAVPRGFALIGDEVSRTRGQLLRQAYRNSAC